MAKTTESAQENSARQGKITVSGNTNKITKKQLESLKKVLNEVAELNGSATIEIKWFDVIE